MQGDHWAVWDDRGHQVHYRLRVLFHQSPPCRFHKHNLYIKELRPLSATQPCKTLAMPSILTEPPPRSSGIATAQNGEPQIPSSTRPDGPKRKEIKICSGYKTPEDMEVYKNRTAIATGREQVLLLGTAKKMQRGREAKKQGWHTQYKWVQPSRPQSNRRNPKIRDQTDRTATSKPKKPKKSAHPEEENPTSTRVERKKHNGDHLLPEQIGRIVKISELVRRPLGFGDDELDLDQVEPLVEP